MHAEELCMVLFTKMSLETAGYVARKREVRAKCRFSCPEHKWEGSY